MSTSEENFEWEEAPLVIDESVGLSRLPYLSDTLWLTNNDNGSINYESVESSVETFFQRGGKRLVIGPSSRVDKLFFDLSKCKSLVVANKYLLNLSNLTNAKSLWHLTIEGNVCRNIRCVPQLPISMLDICFAKSACAKAYCEILRMVKIARANFYKFPLDTFNDLNGFAADILRIESSHCVDTAGLTGRVIQLYGCRKLEVLSNLSCFNLDCDGCLKLNPERISTVANLHTLRFRSYAKSPQSWNWLAHNKTIRMLTLLGKGNTMEIIKMPRLELLDMHDTSIKKDSARKLSKLNPSVLIAHGNDYFSKGGAITSEEFYARKKAIEETSA